MSGIAPDRRGFAQDPLGYAALAWHKWTLAQALATGDFGVLPKSPGETDFKNALLWLTQAHALSVAARAVISHEPKWETMPVSVRGACDSQYCGAGLMLVGYSLEVCLKAMLILRHGVANYTSDEKKFQHHKLERLAEFLPSLDQKDKAILRALTHYIEWAGRYPDPGGGRDAKFEEVFSLSERHMVSARELFSLAGRVMHYANVVVEQQVGSGDT